MCCIIILVECLPFEKMERYSIAQRINIVKTYYKNNDSPSETHRALRKDFGRHNRPVLSTISSVVAKFERTGSVADDFKPTRFRSARSVENIAATAASVDRDDSLSIPRRRQELGLSYGSLWRILNLDLHLHPYKVQLVQKLEPGDHGMRRVYAKWVLEQQKQNPDFSYQIFFSDEAHFHLGGYVNTQNCRHWGSENPRVVVEKPMHPLRVTVWCALWSGGVIGPYFFENDEGRTVTVNSDRYGQMLTSYFLPAIEDMDTDNMWFQQDGATCHTTRDNMAIIRSRFEQRLISRFSEFNWPSRSCDLNPLDFFLWGYAKDRVYADNPQSLDHLKNNIRDVLAELQPAICKKVIENYLKRIEVCEAALGGHLSDILFHK